MDWLFVEPYKTVGVILAAFVIVVIGLALLSLAMKVFPRFDPFGDRCPACKKTGLRQYPLHTNPPAGWSIWDCIECGAEFVKENGQKIPRREYNGPSIVEFFFRTREFPERDSQELMDQLLAERGRSDEVGGGSEE